MLFSPSGEAILVWKINIFITLPVIQWENAFVFFVFSIFEEGGKRKSGLPSSTTGKNWGQLKKKKDERDPA